MRADQEHCPEARGRLPRRGTDRLEDAAAWLLSSLALIAVLAAVVVGVQVHGSELERARLQAAERTPVTAVLLKDTPVVPAADRGPTPSVRVPAHWVGRDGAEHVGVATVRGPLSAGARVPAWVDRGGKLVPPPATPGQATMVAVTVAVVLLFASSALLGLAWTGVRRWVEALNGARWAREWAQVEAEWSGRAR